ncbi:hypothetical protein C8Q77DRAFT_473334 [Trametes polyzona]|nr:hypothetical protein C8Q77DRAFT_473334 [Trametes polyzona]
MIVSISWTPPHTTACVTYHLVDIPTERSMVRMLYGLTVHQVYIYVGLYRKDRPLLKGYVAVVFILESLHTVLWVSTAYRYALAHPFSSESLAPGTWSARLLVLSTSSAIGATQCFYAYRVYMNPRHKWLVIPALVVLVVGQGFAFTAGIKAFKETESILDFERISWLISVAYGLAVVIDVLLAGSLVFVLRRSRTGSRRGDTMLDTLIIYTINTGALSFARTARKTCSTHAGLVNPHDRKGALTSICSILSFVFALILPGNLIYAGISIVGTKLYANSALAMLNSRRAIKDQFLDDFSIAQIPYSTDRDARHPRASTVVWGAPRARRSRRLSELDCASVVSEAGGMSFGTETPTTSVSVVDVGGEASVRGSDVSADAC